MATDLSSKKKQHTFGYVGDCQLSELAFIDRESSFMSDTLHSIYHGAFVSYGGFNQWLS